MIKSWLLLAIVLISGSACAKSTCADMHGPQSYQPLSIKNGTVCFVQEPMLDPKTRTPIGADAISLYYIFNGNSPVKAEGRGLLYDDTPGEIVDAFSSSVGYDHRERIFVIHAMNVRESLVEPNSSGKFYSVAVFDLIGNTLRRDERASDWFGADYSWLSDGRRVTYKFPYQSRVDVQLAMDSPFAALMTRDEFIPVKLKGKSYLFDGPNFGNKTTKYLIKGDRATIDKVTAGWCQANYSGGAKPLEMWLMCSALDIDEQAKKLE
ncbi:hypothetical protein B0G69_6591 [Paraburkholderia sp. RAU2J]|uniref:hypothetical protein n=1 Tax=Paraburkholderia sp. RAU2J TaxID=1938810 RepID=UPI000F0F04EE|nr:hypothetical protein [Paraburkholderia sp. RAU2J]RKT13441.1 hypothetical protein B0G69_6591 [Paraburkholderia sp. RAU2J]